MKADQTRPDDAGACVSCPWRISNHGKSHPDGWFTAANRRRLWAQLRQGEAMSCHRTDPDNPVSDAAVAAGYKRVPEGTQVKECTGAVVLAQREAMIWQDDHAGSVKDYRKARPRGLTREGLVATVMRVAFGGVPIVGGPPVQKPNLNDPTIGAGLPGVDWTPHTREEPEPQQEKQ